VTIFTAVESAQDVLATITANVVGGAAGQQVQATLDVQTVGVGSLTFTPSVIRGQFGVTTCTITLDAPAPAGGTLVTLTQTTPLLGVSAGGYLIPEGSTSTSFPLKGIRVSRSLSTLVTAGRADGLGSSSAALVIVTR